jgi:hypothetical protein
MQAFESHSFAATPPSKPQRPHGVNRAFGNPKFWILSRSQRLERMSLTGYQITIFLDFSRLDARAPVTL